MMTVFLDPDDHEIQALLDLTGELRGKSILEVGCGDGRLTRKIAPLAEQVIAIDPKEEKILQAKRALPGELHANLTFIPLDIEEYFRHVNENDAKRAFDLVLFSWSL